jgi:hypothetical protein
VERETRERVSIVDAESAAMLASAREEVEDLAQRITLLEGELTEACQAWEKAEENSWGLSDIVADAEQWWKESEREHR